MNQQDALVRGAMVAAIAGLLSPGALERTTVDCDDLRPGDLPLDSNGRRHPGGAVILCARLPGDSPRWIAIMEHQEEWAEIVPYRARLGDGRVLSVEVFRPREA